jgi:hypothetical protein
MLGKLKYLLYMYKYGKVEREEKHLILQLKLQT